MQRRRSSRSSSRAGAGRHRPRRVAGARCCGTRSLRMSWSRARASGGTSTPPRIGRARRCSAP
eukprot:scaffold87521_cov30-Phaeocystis_antarctica.AAC.1